MISNPPTFQRRRLGSRWGICPQVAGGACQKSPPSGPGGGSLPELRQGRGAAWNPPNAWGRDCVDRTVGTRLWDLLPRWRGDAALESPNADSEARPASLALFAECTSSSSA